MAIIQAKNLIPPIGTKGIFVLEEPFQQRLVEKVAYTCQAVRSIRDTIASGSDPFSEYYEPFELSKEQYEGDVANGAAIVSLQSGVGDWLYVPSTFIKSYPDMNGVMYTPIVLGISLGAVPDEMNLSALKSDIEALVRDTIGINSTVKSVVAGLPTLVPQEDHRVATAARAEMITRSNTDRSRLLAAQETVNALTLKVQELEAYIQDNLM